MRTLLETISDFNIIGEADDGKEALVLVERLHPELVVLYYVMPRLNGPDVTRQLYKKLPETHVVFLSIHADKVYTRNAIESGAKGYIVKDNILDHLLKAVRAAATGRPYFSPCLSVPTISSGKGD